jgi:hypothetical protein
MTTRPLHARSVHHKSCSQDPELLVLHAECCRHRSEKPQRHRGHRVQHGGFFDLCPGNRGNSTAKPMTTRPLHARSVHHKEPSTLKPDFVVHPSRLQGAGGGSVDESYHPPSERETRAGGGRILHLVSGWVAGWVHLAAGRASGRIRLCLISTGGTARQGPLSRARPGWSRGRRVAR